MAEASAESGEMSHPVGTMALMAKTPDAIMTELAVTYGGALTRAMLVDAGVSSRTIQRRISSGVLRPIAGRALIYEPLRSTASVLHATTLAYPGSAVARHTAAALHGLPVKPEPFRVVVPHGTSHAIHGIRLHETRHLPAEDVLVRNNLPICTVARTLCDMAATESLGWMRHLVQSALTQQATSPDALRACAAERFRRRAAGMNGFLSLLVELLDDEPLAESVAELRFFAVLREVGLTNITRQWMPPWYDGVRGIVDAKDELSPTIYEVDGRGFRQTTQAHDNDRARDRRAARHGHLVLRVGALELERAPFRIGTEIKEVTEQRRRQFGTLAA